MCTYASGHTYGGISPHVYTHRATRTYAWTCTYICTTKGKLYIASIKFNKKIGKWIESVAEDIHFPIEWDVILNWEWEGSVSKLNRAIQLSDVGAGFACPKTQSKQFSGEPLEGVETIISATLPFTSNKLYEQLSVSSTVAGVKWIPGCYHSKKRAPRRMLFHIKDKY